MLSLDVQQNKNNEIIQESSTNQRISHPQLNNGNNTSYICEYEQEQDHINDATMMMMVTRGIPIHAM